MGLSTAFLSASWNFYYFGFSLRNFLVGGYTSFGNETQSFEDSYFRFTRQQFLEGLGGLLISPNRGLLIYSPITALAIPGSWQLFRQFRKRGWDRDEGLLVGLAIASLLIFLQYCFFVVWPAGTCYGTRYLTDIMPVLCLLVSYFLADFLAQHPPTERSTEAARLRIRFQRWGLALITVLMLYSTSIQAIGVFGETSWNHVPYSVMSRYWQWHDSEIARHASSLYYRWHNLVPNPRKYRRELAGKLEQVRDLATQTSLQNDITFAPFTEHLIEAELTNTGQSPWFGYETGSKRWMTALQIDFFDAQNQLVIPKPDRENWLYVSGNHQRGERAIATGLILFPQEPGVYQMQLTLRPRGSARRAEIPPLPGSLSVRVQR